MSVNPYHFIKFPPSLGVFDAQAERMVLEHQLLGSRLSWTKNSYYKYSILMRYILTLNSDQVCANLIRIGIFLPMPATAPFRFI